MKKLGISLILALGMLLITPGLSTAQVVVKVRPIAPTTVVVKPNRPSPRHVWIDGYWVYDNRRRTYVYRNGSWVKPRRGKVWVSGRWVRARGGWKYVPGYWR